MVCARARAQRESSGLACARLQHCKGKDGAVSSSLPDSSDANLFKTHFYQSPSNPQDPHLLHRKGESGEERQKKYSRKRFIAFGGWSAVNWVENPRHGSEFMSVMPSFPPLPQVE